MTRAARTDFATMSPELLEQFHRFAETGNVVVTLPTKRACWALRAQIYRMRLMITDARARGDMLAQELFPSAQYIYIEVLPVENTKDPNTPHVLHMTVSPLARATHGDKLPWKET